MFSVASWNIRGLNRSLKQKEVRQVVNENNLSVCAILESRVDVAAVYDTCKKVCSRWKWNYNRSLCSKGNTRAVAKTSLLSLVFYLLSDDVSHNLASEVISDHEPEQNESSITFSPRSDPLHHEFAGEVITLPSRNDREFGEYLSLMTVLCEIFTHPSPQENVHAHQSSVIESLPISPIPVEDSEPVQEDIDIFLVPDDLIPRGVENDISKIGR
ncbi:RNA-directed DNA polymerase, eukaryota, reverse transcriptase zinc-binding domain protein [Tanacetum coccineum]